MGYDYLGKLILVTGASEGLGSHLADAYHGEGADLALVARDAERLNQKVRSLTAGSGQARIYPMDLLQIQGIPELLDRVTSQFGRPVDVLVHCAAMSCYGEIERTPFDVIEQVNRLNYLAGVRMVQEVLVSMKQRRSGQIVWIGSASAYLGRPMSAAYTASKAAAKCFCEALRGEVQQDGIDVLLVMPGGLKTDFHESQSNFSSNGNLRPLRAPIDPGPLSLAIVKAGKLRQEVLVYGRSAQMQERLSRWAPGVLFRAYQESMKR